MPEIVVRNFLGMQTMNTNIDVEISLDVITHITRPLELLPSPTHTVRQRLVPLWNPTTLHPSPLLLIPLLLLVLTEKSSDRLDCLLRVHLLVTTSWLSSLHKLGDRPSPQWLNPSRNTSLVFRGVIGELLNRRMLRKGRLEVRTIHQHIPRRPQLLRVLRVHYMEGHLVWLDLRMRMDGSTSHTS